MNNYIYYIRNKCEVSWIIEKNQYGNKKISYWIHSWNRTILMLIILIYVPSLAVATTYYVDNGSSGCLSYSDISYDVSTRTCGSGSQIVYDTIQGAVNGIDLNAGDILEVRDGTYYEQVTISSLDSGQPSYPVKIAAYDGESVTIDGGRTKSNGITVSSGTADLVIDGFIVDKWIAASAGDGIIINSSTRITVTNVRVNIIEDTSGPTQNAIHFENCSNCTADSNIVTTDDASWNTQTDGFKISKSDNSVFSNNTVIMRNGWNSSDTHGDTMQVMGSANLKIYNNDISSTKNSYTQGIFLTVPDLAYFDAKDYGTTYVYNNILHGKLDNAGIILECDKSGATCAYEVYNNAIIQEKDDARGAVGIRVLDDYAKIKNNIIRNDYHKTTINVENYDQNPGDIDYNLHFSSLGFRAKWGGTFHASISSWRAASGASVNEIESNPSLDANFRPNTTNTNIMDSGQRLNTIFTFDKRGVARPQGLAWDKGVFEVDHITPMPPTNLRRE